MPFVRIAKCMSCGIPHEWLFDGMKLKELRTIKTLTGMRTQEFSESMEALDPDAVAALVYILHERSGITVRFDDIDLDFADFDIEPTDEERAEIEELEKRMQAEAENAQAPKLVSDSSAVKPSARPKSGPKMKAASGHK